MFLTFFLCVHSISSLVFIRNSYGEIRVKVIHQVEMLMHGVQRATSYLTDRDRIALFLG
jgi:hypothetical protein